MIAACNSSKSNTNEVETVGIDMESYNDFISSDYVLDSSFVQLIRLNGENLTLGKIESIQISRNNICVLNEDRSAVLIFGEDGSFINKVDRYGNAGDEYSDITDFCIDNDTIYILDQNKQKIHKLLFDGRYIGHIDISKIWGNQLMMADNELFVINERSDTELGKFHLFKVLEDRIEPYIPFKKPAGLEMQKSHSGNYVFIRESNTLYQIKNGQPEVLFALDFGNLSLPDKYVPYDARQLISSGVSDKFVLGVDRIEHSGNLLFLHCDAKGIPVVALLDVTDRTVKFVCRGFRDSMFYGAGLCNYIVSDGYLYDIYYADELCMILDNHTPEDLKEEYKKKREVLRKSLTPDDNPIIFKYKISI